MPLLWCQFRRGRGCGRPAGLPRPKKPWWWWSGATTTVVDQVWHTTAESSVESKGAQKNGRDLAERPVAGAGGLS